MKRVTGRKSRIIIAAIALLAILAAVGVYRNVQKQGVQESAEISETMQQSEISEDYAEVSDTEAAQMEETAQTEEPVEGLTFPLKLDKDRLELGSVFEYSGINPDCGNEFSDSVGALEIVNISGQYLEYAKITVELADGGKLEFLIQDIPADTTVLAFELQNQGYTDEIVTGVVTETDYGEGEIQEAIVSSVSATEITLQNISQQDKTNIAVKYHCVFDDIYFGGKSWELTLDALQAGESTVLSAKECYMGDAVVSKITCE